MKKNKLPEEQTGEKPENAYTGAGYAYAAIALTAAGVVALGLIFTVLRIYALIASVILSLSALTFVNIQKRKNDFEKLKIIKVCAYVVFALSIAVLVGGIIWYAL